MTSLSANDRALFEGKNLAHLATVCADGGPAVSPVWVMLEGDRIVVNSAEGRLKVRNMRRDPRVGISVHDQRNLYRMVSVRGRVSEMTTEDGDEIIDRLSEKYTGNAVYRGRRPGQVRVTIRIEPEQVASMGLDS